MRRVVQAGCLAEGSRGESYLVFEHGYSMPVTPGLHFTVEVHAMSVSDCRIGGIHVA